MRVLLLLCLLTLGNAKPYQPINVMDFMKNYDIMMADSGDADDDDDDDVPFCIATVLPCEHFAGGGAEDDSRDSLSGGSNWSVVGTLGWQI